jgi:4-oxalocrotonate tautomerase
MPYVNVKLIDDSVSPQAKAEVIRRITDVLVEVLNKNPETTFVVIEEVSIDNWGVAGQTVRARQVVQRSQLDAKNS